MTSEEVPPQRADARRNRDRLLRAAAAAFGAGDEPALEAVAAEAGVGIGTLYRHFPSREALVEAVYRSELHALCEKAQDLLAAHEPSAALRQWMGNYADFVTTKRHMADTLRAVFTAGAIPSALTRNAVTGAVAAILAAGAEAKSLRADVDPDDVVTALLGVFLATDGPADRARIDRLLDLLAAGLRA